MAGDNHQPRYLTLVESVFNYSLFCGVGYLVAGASGAWCGAGIMTARYAYLIWHSAMAPDVSCIVDQTRDR